MRQPLLIFSPCLGTPENAGFRSTSTLLWAPHRAGAGRPLLISFPCSGTPENAGVTTRQAPVDKTKPLVVGDWLGDKDILAWVHDNLYREVGKPRRGLVYSGNIHCAPPEHNKEVRRQ